MISVGYLISVTAPHSNREVWLTVRKIAGRGQALFGIGNESANTDLFIIPACEKSIQELTRQLEAVPSFYKVAVATLSKPIKETELVEVRKIFTAVDMDPSSIQDHDLTLFLESKLEGQYHYNIGSEIKRNEKGLFNLHIKGLEKHPQ